MTVTTPRPTGWRRAGAAPLRAVLLDLGDTLMHVDPSVPELYRRSLRELGVRVTAKAVTAALRSAEVVYREAVGSGRPFESSVEEARAFWEEYNAHLVASLGVGDGPRRELARRLSERFWAPQSWRPFPEVLGVLRELRRRGLRLGIVSNFTEALVTVCRRHALDEVLDCVVASTVTGTQKPQPGIFAEALRRLGVGPEAAVHVGDNYVADVLGARAAGLDAVLVDRSRRGVAGMFDFALRPGVGQTRGVVLDCVVVGDLTELLALCQD